MIADFAIHDKGDGNPHAHIMLTMRAMDEKGKWIPKSRKVYDLDGNGERIRLPSGRWKSHKENTVDWNDQKYNYNRVQAAMDFLRKKEISTVESLDARLDGISQTAVSVMGSIKKSEKRIKAINTKN